MQERKLLDQFTSYPPQRPEIRLKARAVSRGVAIGPVVCLYGANRQFYRYTVGSSEVENEIERFRTALARASDQLKELELKSSKLPAPFAGIVEAQRLMVEDEILAREIENEIGEKSFNAEWAVKATTDRYAARYRALKDEHLRERAADVEDIGERVLTALVGANRSGGLIEQNSVLACEDLRPSTLAELAGRLPTAIMTEHGGWTSHTFILARELNIPAVTGLRKLLRRARNGDMAIVDGFTGLVILNPTSESLERYQLPAAQFAEIDQYPAEVAPAPPVTLDGREVRIMANLDLPEVYRTARSFGARGVGLCRSEYLFNQHKGFPSEEEQVEVYKELTDLADSDGVHIRTFDVGVERLASAIHGREKNPALGLRAIRLGITYRDILETQLRALLRASEGRALDIIVPMVSGVAEIRSVKEIVEGEKERLIREGIRFGEPRIGAMIEVPAAVYTIDQILTETDFISVGTNDLIQYLLAVDRDNELVADWFNSLHPAVLKVIRDLVRASERHGKPLIVCGEMAGSPYYAPLLVGLGVEQMSMNINSIRRVRRVISGLRYEEAREVAEAVLRLSTPEECESLLKLELGRRWSHLVPASSL